MLLTKNKEMELIKLPKKVNAEEQSKEELVISLIRSLNGENIILEQQTKKINLLNILLKMQLNK